jgi:transposase InsO family protein
VPRPAEAGNTHLGILRALLASPVQRKKPRGAIQAPRRELEDLVRQRAVGLQARLRKKGDRPGEAAARLSLSERTLRCWKEGAEQARAVPARGRPLQVADAAQRQAVRSCLEALGPGVGVPHLRDCFAELARAELRQLLQEYRQCWRAEHPRLLHVLTWQRAGTVWAMDFAEAPVPIAGGEAYLLAVRDLASGQQLLWKAVAAPTADVVLEELPWLFTQHGAPLVLKTDNGSAFIADALRWYLRGCGVGQLFSPPRRPAYNGSIEASIGSMKRRTERHSATAGHPEWWGEADLEAARVEANQTARPRRLHGATPAQVWEQRCLLTSEERASFQQTVRACRAEAPGERGWSLEEPLSRGQEAAVDRVAYGRALVAHDLLLYRRRGIPPQITRPNAATKG